MHVIEVEDLQKKYSKEVTAIKSLSLKVDKGSIVAIVGSNGAGKTTFIRILIGTLTQTGGSVKIFGKNPQKSKQLIRSKIGYMPQNTALYEDLTAREVLNFFAKAQGVKQVKTKVNELLKFLELEHRSNSLVHTFSGGMKKKLSLACAMVHDPDILFLDEPTSAIDPILRESIWNTFRELTKKGVTVVLTTHSMEEALKSDKVILLQNGELILDSKPQEILSYGKSIVSFKINNELKQLEVNSKSNDIAKAFYEHGLNENIKDISIKQESLEDIIVRIIKDKKDE